MKKKKNGQKNNRNLIILLTFICIAVIALTTTQVVSVSPIRNVASVFIIPFQKGINGIADAITGATENANADKKRISELENQVNTLKEENLLLVEGQNELERLRGLYQLDADYSQYEKIGANVISKDTGNWYSSFIINKGANDGIAIDMNVIADGGLVGLVTETGSDWSRVRAIIDESSNVSAMTIAGDTTCIVSGDLTLLEDGLLSFSQMTTERTIKPGEKLVTSNISDKYLPGIFIGSIKEIQEDTNKLTKIGTILPAVDFHNIREVFVITTLKQTVKE